MDGLDLEKLQRLMRASGGYLTNGQAWVLAEIVETLIRDGYEAAMQKANDIGPDDHL